MSFLSARYLFFIVITFLLYYVLPHKWQRNVLLLASLVFYYLNNYLLSICLILSILSVYYGAILIQKKDSKKKLIFILTILFNILFLIGFKYSNIYLGLYNFVLGKNISFTNIIVPLGLSYYTLEALSYLIDTYNNKYKADKNIINVALYLLYFPLLIEGPISRYNDLNDQFNDNHKFNYKHIINACVLIGFGLLKKLVIADRAAIYVNNVFNKDYTGIAVLIAILLYTLEIYADFSGCMDIVMGISELFGIKLKANFKQPFFSKTINEFWTRWHITLGTWLKDYIFYPLSISKTNQKIGLKLRKKNHPLLGRFITIIIPLFFVWFLMGLWHGPTIKYILYGMYYYILMILGIILKPLEIKIMRFLKINMQTFSFKLFQMFRTTILVMIGMLIFASSSITSALNTIKNVFGANMVQISSLGLTKADFRLLFIMILVLLLISYMKENGINIREKLQEQNLPFRWFIYLLLIFSIIIFGMYGTGYNPADFIYGGF